MIPKVEFSLKTINDNIVLLLTKCKNVSFVFPVKCCNNRSVLELVADLGLGFDVSNKNEYELIKDYCDQRIICSSGPLSYELYDIPNVLVATNSIGRWNGCSGIRVNFNSDNRFDISHFGVDYTTIEDRVLDKIEYVHFHNSDYRSTEKCKYIIENIKKIIDCFPKLQTLNIGGHLEDLSFDDGIEYINKVRETVPINVKLIVEAGDFLFKNSGKLVCEVIDCYINGNSQIVILNFSKMAHQRWVHPVLNTNNIKRESALELNTVFYGCSCCEEDKYLETKSHHYSIGEIVEFSNISPYSYQWKRGFNGINSFDYFFVDK